MLDIKKMFKGIFIEIGFVFTFIVILAIFALAFTR